VKYSDTFSSYLLIAERERDVKEGILIKKLGETIPSLS
jgi:hypothetical protein